MNSEVTSSSSSSLSTSSSSPSSSQRHTMATKNWRRRSNAVVLGGLCLVLVAGGTLMHQGQLMKSFWLDNVSPDIACRNARNNMTIACTLSSLSIHVKKNKKEDNDVGQKYEDDDDTNNKASSSSVSWLSSADENDVGTRQENNNWLSHKAPQAEAPATIVRIAEESLPVKQKRIKATTKVVARAPPVSSSASRTVLRPPKQRVQNKNTQAPVERKDAPAHVANKPVTTRTTTITTATATATVRAKAYQTGDWPESNRNTEPATFKNEKRNANQPLSSTASTSTLLLDQPLRRPTSQTSTLQTTSKRESTKTKSGHATTGPTIIQSISVRNKNVPPTFNNSNNNQTIHDTIINHNVSLDDFRLCRVQPAPIFGQATVAMEHVVMPVEYQCAGEPYEEFASQLERLIHFTAAKQTHNYVSRWGRRKRLLPSPATTSNSSNSSNSSNTNNSNKERAILIMGNSHTRQIASTLLCQYRHGILNSTWLFSLPEHRSYGVLQVQLKHNITIYVATNCPFVYSHEWHVILESPKLLNRSLNSLDAIVVGRFNHYTESTGTKFYNAIMSYQQQFPDLQLDFEHILPPTMDDVARVYTAGPIIYVGMFASYGIPLYRQAQSMVRNIVSNRTNQLQQQQQQGFAVINGRKYIRQLIQMDQEFQKREEAATSDASTTTITGTKIRLPVQECSSDSIHSVSTCNTNTTSIRYRDGHRCMGARGGHPDLIVWDMVDALHQLIVQQQKRRRDQQQQPPPVR